MNNDLEKYSLLLYIFLGLAALIVAIALLVSTINLGRDIFTPFIIATYKIAFTMSAGAVGIYSVYKLIEWVFVTINRRIDELQENYDKQFQKLNRRNPFLITVLVVICDTTMILADKAYSGDVVPTIFVSVFLIMAFFVAFQQIDSQIRIVRISGIITYILSLAFLPATAFYYHQWNMKNVLNFISKLNTLTIAMFILTLVLFLGIPLITYKLISMEKTPN